MSSGWSGRLPNEWALIEGKLLCAALGKWRVLPSAACAGGRKNVLVAGLALATKDGRHVVLRSAEDETSTGELDARFSPCARLSLGDVTCPSEWTCPSSRQRMGPNS